MTSKKQEQEFEIKSDVDFNGIFGSVAKEIEKIIKKVIRDYATNLKFEKVKIKSMAMIFTNQNELLKYLPNKEHLSKNQNIIIILEALETKEENYQRFTDFIVEMDIQYYDYNDNNNNQKSIPILIHSLIKKIKGMGCWKTH